MALLAWISAKILGLAARCTESLEPEIAAIGKPGRPPQWLAWRAGATFVPGTTRPGTLPRLLNQDRSHIQLHSTENGARALTSAPS